MLAYGYGTPQVYSGFALTTGTTRRRPTPNGFITDTDCGTRLGLHRPHHRRGRTWSAGTTTSARRRCRTGTTTAVNLISFSRGTKGWISINNDPTAQTQHRSAPGCRRAPTATSSTARVSHGTCTGPTVSVDKHGKAHVTVPAKDSVAIDVNSRV